MRLDCPLLFSGGTVKRGTITPFLRGSFCGQGKEEKVAALALRLEGEELTPHPLSAQARTFLVSRLHWAVRAASFPPRGFPLCGGTFTSSFSNSISPLTWEFPTHSLKPSCLPGKPRRRTSPPLFLLLCHLSKGLRYHRLSPPHLCL